MHRARVLQHLPILRRQAGTVAQYQRRQARLAALGIHRHQALANSIAPGIAGRCEAFTVFYRCSGTDTLGQQPGFMVNSMEIEQARRPLERQRQAPTFAAVHHWPAVPGHADTLGQPPLAQPAVGQFKAHARTRLLGQADHTPLHPASLPVQGRLQSIIQRPLRAEASPAQPHQEEGQGIGPKRQQHQGQHQHGQ
ncbi:hypothetical protein PFL603g_00313 [Pseudomonas fluorescens]|uniref:Uncharacterized protein n=1 Tax=Pseudomonas fluorescens TaxID=294 RepID=A0A120G544_PSEFL|nr:hypothetical protein PFL603g_00313 [Pseudomonas fluorescens]